MKGAFQTSREIFDNPIWQDVAKFRIFFFIVGNAVFSEEGTRVGGVHIARGQYLRSYRNLQKDLSYLEGKTMKEYPLTTLKRKIDALVKEERLILEETECGTLFTVVNYSLYQGFENYKSSTRNSDGTVMEQFRNTDGTVTEQSWNKNNNVNNLIPFSTTTTTKRVEESDQSLMDIHMKVFGTLSMTGLMQDFVQKLLKQGCSEKVIGEMILEAGEGSGGKPNLRYLETIANRWIREGITSREQSKQQKEEAHEQPIFSNQNTKSRRYTPPSASPSISDERMQQLVERSQRKLNVSAMSGNRNDSKVSMGGGRELPLPWETGTA